MTADENAPLSDPLEPGSSVGQLAERRAASRSIARMSESRELSARQLDERRLIHRDDTARMQADAFREIRTRLLALGGDQNFVTMVVPVSSGCGGSFVARNLAAAFAFDEAKTALLIDCNPRHPAQQKALGIEAGPGLIDYLDHPAIGVEPIIYRTGIPRLRLIPAGKPRELTGEYFSSFRMRAVLDSLRCRYPDRYLFLDGPATKGSPDARILSELADFVVLVAGYGRDTPAAIAQAAAAFDPNRFAGVVFNQLP
ncbi:polysaccharide biosynthesis protein [Dokdonella sp.]|uniref:polysaccharide biosynthesis protein n=1 Tax=Dokdonella sp. TaxID=2291710 RepID=UPI001B2ABB4F|nr:polysaccharide biosynthesis protein [Dokdonella sp.]MBO9661992.1 polysaccharide biosynthesis protein [Dokdonella sp.]